MADHNAFADLLGQLAPSIGAALLGFNKRTQPIRDYYNPVFGLGRELAQRGGERVNSILEGPRPNYVPPGQSLRKTILGERMDLAAADFLEDKIQRPAQQIGSYLGDAARQAVDFQVGLPRFLLSPNKRRRGRDPRGGRQRNPNPTIPNYSPGRAALGKRPRRG